MNDKLLAKMKILFNKTRQMKIDKSKKINDTINESRKANIRSEDTIDKLLTLFEKNRYIKKNEEEKINQFATLYNIINNIEPQNISYEEIIESPELRLRFLASSIDIVTENIDIDLETQFVVFEMFENLYYYLSNKSGLQDIEVPKQFKDKMFITDDNGKENFKKDILIPTPSNITFLLTLLRENRRIYDEEIKGLDLSHKINEGLHKNINEVLSIEEKDVSHMLGVNNEAHHLFDFFRKKYMDKELFRIFDLLQIKTVEDMNDEKTKLFTEKFAEKFGLPYSKDNYHLIVGLRYNNIEKMLTTGKITEEQAAKLRASYNEASKSMTIDFYSSKSTEKLLSDECVQNSDFVYEYIRRNIIARKLTNKNDRIILLEGLAKEKILNHPKIIELNEKKKEIENSTLSDKEKKKEKQKINKEIKQIEETEIFSQTEYQNYINKILDFNINSNEKTIRKLIDKYIETFGNHLKKDNNFQEKFKERFGYEYPLIDYYEVLGKNISFYNFSLMKNINSIIVDFNAPKKNPNIDKDPDVYLVSYSRTKIDRLKKKVFKTIGEENAKLTEEAMSNDADMTNEYIAALRSLCFFPPDDRYYFKDSFTSKLREKHESNIIQGVEEQHVTKANDIFSLMGFFTTNEEDERISKMRGNTEQPFNHKHKFKTNITSNYHKFVTHFKKFGHEYLIGAVFSEDPIKKNKRVLRINDTGPEALKKYVELFNEYHHNIKLGFEKSPAYENYLITSINEIVDGYQRLKESKIKMLKYIKNVYLHNENDINQYELIIKEEEISLKNFNIYYSKTKNYFKEYKEHFMQSMYDIKTEYHSSKKGR